MIIDPTRIYEVQGQRYELQTATLVAAVANNQSIIAAVSGYIHYLMGWKIYSLAGGATDIDLKAGSGGTVLMNITLPAANKDDLPVIDSAYFKLATNQALVCDVNTTGVHLNIFYLTIKG